MIEAGATATLAMCCFIESIVVSLLTVSERSCGVNLLMAVLDLIQIASVLSELSCSRPAAHQCAGNYVSLIRLDNKDTDIAVIGAKNALSVITV